MIFWGKFTVDRFLFINKICTKGMGLLIQEKKYLFYKKKLKKNKKDKKKFSNLDTSITIMINQLIKNLSLFKKK